MDPVFAMENMAFVELLDMPVDEAAVVVADAIKGIGSFSGAGDELATDSSAIAVPFVAIASTIAETAVETGVTNSFTASLVCSSVDEGREVAVAKVVVVIVVGVGLGVLWLLLWLLLLLLVVTVVVLQLLIGEVFFGAEVESEAGDAVTTAAATAIASK